MSDQHETFEEYRARLAPALTDDEGTAKALDITVRNGVVSVKRLVPFDRRLANWR